MNRDLEKVREGAAGIWGNGAPAERTASANTLGCRQVGAHGVYTTQPG